jgi:endonuclease/exonuclease/phosphatase family metal-dependent hydrolase
VASLNLFFLNHAHERTIDWVRRASPEVVAFMEVTPEWRRALRALDAQYPHQVFAADRSHHAVLLLSRWPLTDRAGHPGDLQLRPAVVVTLTKPSLVLRLAALHASWPASPQLAVRRAGDLDALADAARHRGALPFIAVGDLNISPFSPHFDAALAAAGLRSAASGRGWQPTWPTFFPPAGIQIDHALVSPEVDVRRFVTGSGTGSDHRPILMDVAFAPPMGHLARATGAAPP